jgi:hypothetical protein
MRRRLRAIQTRFRKFPFASSQATGLLSEKQALAA